MEPVGIGPSRARDGSDRARAGTSEDTHRLTKVVESKGEVDRQVIRQNSMLCEKRWFGDILKGLG